MIKTEEILTQELGCTPSVEQVAVKMHLPVEKVSEINKANKIITTSLNQLIVEDEEAKLEDFIPDKKTEVADLVTDKMNFIILLKNSKKILTEREYQVLVLRYGLYGNKIQTQKETAKVLNVTYQRIQQLESKALRKLRNHCKIQKLYPYESTNITSSYNLKTPNVKTNNTGKTPKKNKNKQIELLEVSKEKLAEEKINLLKGKLYEELYKKYKTLIDTNTLEIIINRIVIIENDQENINEYQTPIENEILLYLLNIYKENSTSVQNQILLNRIKILFRNKVKKQYPNISIERIDIAIEETFISYTGERSFEEELESRMKN